MRSAAYCQRLFTVGALWNWGVAGLITALALFELEGIAWFLNEVPKSFLWLYFSMGAVAVFGLGYYWVGRDVQRNRAIIKMGVVGKTMVFALILPAWQTGEVTALTAAAATVDLVFTILFIDVLMKNPA
ncbi:MAG: hypothetical protein JRH14_19190 [Deltaproteobacteria bacterium]|nr:hypothetical protein [Deltaproteobacteria bacterium]MBW2381224.1 hypothetical protein [Deltaproteobacteria bacterium]MBW2548704.1 hypothetical protein [Deltaproteobacteria bacterium]MBW2719198.1 hypothetical protein [Deltaproteobacteria bacterium]